MLSTTPFLRIWLLPFRSLLLRIEDLSSGVVSGFIEKCMSGTERLDFISSRLGLGPPLFFLLI